MAKRITQEEGIEYLKAYGTPEHVIKHCIAVTDAAVAVASELNRCGYNLDIPLITGAGILHDIARVYDSHEILGAEFAESIGLFEESKIIRMHMRYPHFNDIKNINEADLICLADRTVKEDEYVGIDERMEYILDKVRKAGLSQKSFDRIAVIRKETETFMKDIENIIGISIDELCGRKK